jgi:hypothetical protein
MLLQIDILDLKFVFSKILNVKLNLYRFWTLLNRFFTRMDIETYFKLFLLIFDFFDSLRANSDVF